MRLPVATPIALVLLAGVGAKAAAVVRAPDPAPGSYAIVHGRRMYYEMHGAGPPLVLLHGGGSTILGSFASQIPVFARTHRVIGVEQLGHGHSDGVDGELSYRSMAEDTADLLRQLSVTQADIVGWSDGGIIGLILAVHHPDLVRRLVISGANIRPDGLEPEVPAPPNPPQSPAERKRAPNHAATMQDKLDRLWKTAPTAADLTCEQLTGIQAPTLVMAGDHDVVRPDHTRKIARLIPHARLCILPDTPHATFSSRPDLVNSLILDFLAEAAPAGAAEQGSSPAAK